MIVTTQPDNELLREYAKAGSETAFAELVKRHVNLVYSAALRQIGGDAHLAHDVAQTVFTDLARKASSLCGRESLAGWLYTSSYFAAGKMIRREMRRRRREEQFMRDPANDATADAEWEKLRPILDAAMHGLKESDREAVLLRYFENRPYAEVGAKLGLTENTARMRVERALEKLRGLLAKRAVTTTAALASILSANAVQVAPPALAVTLSQTSLAAVGAGTSIGILKLMTLAQIKVGLGVIAVAGTATTILLQHQTQQRLQTENEGLRAQIAQSTTQNQDAPVTNSQPMTSDEFNELLRLRGEVGALRAQTNQLAQVQAQNLQLREAFSQLTQQKQQLQDPPDSQQQTFTIQQLNTAKQAMLGMILYAGDHRDEFPTNFEQASPYYGDKNSEVSTNLGQFEMVFAGVVSKLANPASAIVVRSIQPFMSRGKWAKAYGFADGHAEVHTEATGNFTDWEQQHVPVLKNQ